MIDYQDELREIIQLIDKRPDGMTITSIAAASGIGRHRVAKYLDVLTLSGRMGMKQIGNAKVFFRIERIPVTSILNLSSDFIIVLNDRQEVVYISDNLLEDERLGRREIIGTAISEIGFSLLPFPNLTHHITKALEGKESMKEYSVLTDGTTRWFRMRIFPTLLEERAEGTGIVLEEITRQKVYQAQLEEWIRGEKNGIPASTTSQNMEKESHSENETALKNSEPLYKTLVDHACEGIIVLEPESGIITFVNPAMAAMLGYTHHELQCRSVFTLTNDTGVRILRGTQSRMTEDETTKEKIQLFHRNGNPVYAEITSTVFHSPGDTGSHWLLLVYDVTDRKETEDAVRFTNTLLNSIIEGSDRMIAAIDLNSAFMTANSAYRDEFQRIFGTLPEPGKRLDEVLSHLPNELMKARRLWARAVQGEVFQTVERFGKENDYEIRLFPLRNEEGEIFGIANLIYDITNLEKAVITHQLQDMQLRELMEAAGHAIFTTDIGGRCTQISPILERFLGYTSSELIGEQILRIIAPADHACMQEYLDAAVQGRSDTATYQMISRSGPHHIVRTVARTSHNKEGMVEIQSVIRDIRKCRPTEYSGPLPLFSPTPSNAHTPPSQAVPRPGTPQHPQKPGQ
jgi:PAS domain S-box-containing protein